MNNKKSLIIPRINGLDSLSAESLANTLMQSGAKAIINIANWPEQYPSCPTSTVAIAHSGQFMHALFSITATETRALITEDLGPVADDTCFEIFLKHPGAPRYWNYEFNILGSANVSSRIERKNPVRFSRDGLQAIERISSCKTPREITRGIASEWLLVSIPLEQLGVSCDKGPVLMEGNFYSCASALATPYYLSWSPIDTPSPDFHRPEFFGYLILE